MKETLCRAGVKNEVALIVSGLNHAMHQMDGEDPPTKGTLKRFEPTNSDGLTQEQYDNLSTFEKMFSTPPGIIASSGGLELIGGPAKGLKYLSKMASKYPGAIVKAEQVGSKYWKYTTEVAGTNGRTIYTKYLNLQGKTIQWFHDSYNASNKFMHREFNAVGGRLKVWYDGTREYIKKF